MIGGRSLRARRIAQPIPQWTALSRKWALPLFGALYPLTFWLFFVVMHLKSQAWARGQVLDPLRSYWRWFNATIFSQEQVAAVRRSAEASWHPLLMLAVLMLMSVAYVWLLLWLRAGKTTLHVRAMIGLVLLASVPLLLLPNLQSGDVYSYISFGRIAVVHGGNPFIDPPRAFGSDRFLRYVNWVGVPSVYGPTWIYLSMLLTALVESIHSHIITYVLSYKLLAMALHIANGVLIWAILGRWRPQQQQWGTALYLLCPLVMIEFIGNGHNDVLMITGILLAVWLHLRGQWPWAIIAFTLAVLTKWIALLLLPLYGLALLWEARTWRERAKRTAVGLALFAAWSVILYSPYWEGTRTLKILVDAPPQKRLINSLGDVVRNDIERVMTHFGGWPDPAILDSVTIFSPPGNSTTPASAALANNPNSEIDEVWRQQARQFSQERSAFRQQQAEATANRTWLNNQIRTIALGVLAACCLLGAAITRSFERALLVGAWLFFVYCSISAVWFWPWYLTWFVALAALLDWRVTGRTAVMFALLAPLAYVFFPPTVDPALWQRYRAVLIFVPPLAFALWHGVALVRTHWRRWLHTARATVSTALTRKSPTVQQE